MFGFGKDEPTATEKVEAVFNEAQAAQIENRPLPEDVDYWPEELERALEETFPPDRPEDWPQPATYQRYP